MVGLQGACTIHVGPQNGSKFSNQWCAESPPQQLPIGSPVGGLLHLIAMHADRLLEITPVNPIGHSAEIFDSRVTRLNSRVGTVHTPALVRLPIMKSTVVTVNYLEAGTRDHCAWESWRVIPLSSNHLFTHLVPACPTELDSPKEY